MQYKLLGAGLQVIGNSPEQFAAAIQSEMIRMGEVIKDTGIKGESLPRLRGGRSMDVIHGFP